MTIVERISKLRFDCLAGYTRQPLTPHYCEEMSWFRSSDEKVLGLVIRDKTDGDYAGNILGRDLKRCFRWVNMTEFYSTLDQAEEALIELLKTSWEM